MNEDLLLYIRLALHLVTFAYLVSYRTTETSRPLVSLIAAMAAGVSLAAAAHIVLMKPQGGQMMAPLLALGGAVAVARGGGRLARGFKGGGVVGMTRGRVSTGGCVLGRGRWTAGCPGSRASP